MPDETSEPVAPKPGRPRTHGLPAMRKTLRALTTRRLDGRSTVAVAARRFKDDLRSDLGGELSRAQEVLLEGAAQKLVIQSALADWLQRQPSLVTRKRTALPVLRDYLQVSDSLEKTLERLGLRRKVRDVDVGQQLAAMHDRGPTC